MVEALAEHLSRVDGLFVRRLLHPASTDWLLARLGPTGRDLEPLFRNTVNATLIRGGDRPNVVPSEIHIGLDGRVLPGFSPDDLMAEIEPALRGDAEARVVKGETARTGVDFGLFDLLARLLESKDRGAVAIPYLLPGSSDGRHLARLGIQTYGYTPMNLPSDVRFFETIHALDERIPIAAVDFGTEILHALIRAGAAVAT
jgi:acetylornithine deacetylase/succinyl-diaminopimelate desuccinylase-like protein